MPSQEHEALVAGIVARGVKTPHNRPGPSELVAMRAADAALPIPAVEGATVQEVNLGNIRCLRVAASERARRTILYCHGGGYVFTTPKFCVGAMAELARRCDAVCVAPFYRLAPEHPFPAPVEDALAVYRAILEAGRAPSDAILSGDSAGGGLAVVLMLAIENQGLPAPRAAVVFSPWTDLTISGASAARPDDPLCDAGGLRMMAEAYLQGIDPKDPLASPLFASDQALAKLSPTLVQVGGREALLDDSRRFVAKAKAAGAPIKSIEHEGVIHMWTTMAPLIPESAAAFDEAAAFIESAGL
jgi:acetyl esterase/lipase